jgi:hypothetical protein
VLLTRAGAIASNRARRRSVRENVLHLASAEWKYHLLLIPDAIAVQLVTFDEVVDCIETAFADLDQGRSTLLDVVRGHAGSSVDSFGMLSLPC